MTDAEALTPWRPMTTCRSKSWPVGRGAKPVESLDDLACPELWDSDEEYEQFLADLYASRRAGLA